MVPALRPIYLPIRGIANKGASGDNKGLGGLYTAKCSIAAELLSLFRSPPPSPKKNIIYNEATAIVCNLKLRGRERDFFSNASS